MVLPVQFKRGLRLLALLACPKANTSPGQLFVKDRILRKHGGLLAAVRQ